MLIVEIAIVILLTLVNGALAMSEMAIVSSRRARLETMTKGAGRGVRAALDLIADPSRFLSTVQIGITVVGIFAGAYGGATLAGPLGESLDRIAWIAPHGREVAIFIVVVVITYLSLVIGELVPKRIALANPERTAAIVSPTMQVLSRIAAPVVWLLRVSSDAVLTVLGISGTPREVVTEEEVKALIAEGTRAGVFAPQEHRMIERVLRLADRSVSVIMTHRSDIAWLDRRADHAEIVALVDENTHSHFLVCDGSIEKAVGIIAARDLLRVALRGEAIDVSKLVLPTLFVSGQTTVLKLIDLIRREAVHAAIVVDEYGTTEGMVTATDILEGIAGSLPDRGLQEEPMVVRRPDGSWLIDGLMPIDEFEDACGLSGLRELGDFQTVAGFVIHSLGRLPKAGDRIEREHATFEVVDMDGRRIDKVLVTRKPATR